MYFSAEILFRKSCFYRISNHLEHVLFRSRNFLRAATFSPNNFFRSKYLLRTVTFLENLVLCNPNFTAFIREKAFHWPWFILFTYSMNWSDFEIPQFFIFKNSKQCINFNKGHVANATSGPNEFRLVSLLRQNFVKNSLKLNSGSLLKVQQCGNEILDSSISFICSFKASRGMEYWFRKQYWEIKQTATFEQLVE